MHKAIVVTDR